MSVKYKIENSKKNKNLIGDEVSVSKIKKHGGSDPKGPKPPRVNVNQLAQNMTELTTTVSQLAKEMRDGFAKQNEFNKMVETQFKAHGWIK